MREKCQALLDIINDIHLEAAQKKLQIQTFLQNFEGDRKDLLNYQDKNFLKRTVFHSIIINSNQEIIDLFINEELGNIEGINLDLQIEGTKRTALNYAIDMGFTDVAEKLIRFGANAFIKDTKGKTAYQLAKAKGYNIIVALAEGKHKLKITEVEDGTNRDHLKRLFLEIIDFNLTNALPNLYLYSSSLLEDILKSIPENKKNNDTAVAIKNFVEENKHEALEIIKLIVKNPNNSETSSFLEGVITESTWLNYEYHPGYTVLTWVIKKGYLNLANSLIEKGANLSLKTLQGKSIFEMLEEKKAELALNNPQKQNLNEDELFFDVINEQNTNKEELLFDDTQEQNLNGDELLSKVTKKDNLNPIVVNYNEIGKFKISIKTSSLPPFSDIDNGLKTAADQKTTFSRKLLSYFIRTEEYKVYNELKDYKFARNKLEHHLENKLNFRIKHALNELKYSKEIDTETVDNILEKWKLEKYIGQNKKQFNNAAEILHKEYNQQRNVIGKVFYHLWTSRHDLNACTYALTSALTISDEFKNIEKNKLNVIMGYDKAKISPGKATFSEKKLQHANWNGYRNSSWLNWAWSFVSSNVNEYSDYTEINNHRKNAFKLLFNIRNIVQDKVSKALEAMVKENKDLSTAAKGNLIENDMKFIDEKDNKTASFFTNALESIADQNKSFSEKLKLALPLAKWSYNEAHIIGSRITHAAESITRNLQKDKTCQTLWRDSISKMAKSTMSK
ncbi:MAG: hypothetical protein ACK4OM_04715 [Alphaproteobacteria bacterium]